MKPDVLENDFLQQAKDIISGKSMMLPALSHLEALEEYRQVSIIKCANLAEQGMRDMLNLP